MGANDVAFAIGAGACWACFAWLVSTFEAGRLIRACFGIFKDALVEIRTCIQGHFGRIFPGASKERSVGLVDVSEMTDIVRLGLLAGLSFDAALGIYCDNKQGDLARQMDRARMSWQMGLASREQALRKVAASTGVRQLESFAAAVDQAYVLGAPLAETLGRQGIEMRAAHRSEVERAIERAPVKLLIPTGTLILPALLLSILGPLLAAGGML